MPVHNRLNPLSAVYMALAAALLLLGTPATAEHDLGRFSSAYRDRFGESPSTTLRR